MRRDKKMSAAAERMRELLEDIRDHKEYSILYMMVVSCISAENNETNEQIAINERNLNAIIDAIDVMDSVPEEFANCRRIIAGYLKSDNRRRL